MRQRINAFNSSAFSISFSAEVEPDVNVGMLLRDSMRELQTFQNSLGLEGSISKMKLFCCSNDFVSGRFICKQQTKIYS